MSIKKIWRHCFWRKRTFRLASQYDDSRIRFTSFFLKDLVTTRNPTSPFTFLNYLKQKQRLHEFINLREFYPSRREFADYYSWIAGQLETYIRYNYEVTNIEAVPYDGINILKIKTRNNRTGEIQEYLTNNLVVATGGIPAVPPGIQVEEGSVFHSHEFMHTIKTYYPHTHHTYRFLIVGSGQSARNLFLFRNRISQCNCDVYDAKI